MTFDPANLTDYKQFVGKLAHVLEDVDGVTQTYKSVKIHQGSVVMILDVAVQRPPRDFYDRHGTIINRERLLRWITFQANFTWAVLFDEDRVVICGKMLLVPKVE